MSRLAFLGTRTYLQICQMSHAWARLGIGTCSDLGTIIIQGQVDSTPSCGEESLDVDAKVVVWLMLRLKIKKAARVANVCAKRGFSLGGVDSRLAE